MSARVMLSAIAFTVLAMSGGAAQLAIDTDYSSQARLVAAIFAGLGAGFVGLLIVMAEMEGRDNV
jgi:hypothetical protein